MQTPGRGSIGAILSAAQGRSVGQRRVALDSGLQRQIVAQAMVVIQICIAQSQTIQALTHQAWKVMRAAGTTSWVIERLGDRLAQAERMVGLPQQQHAAVAGNVTTVKLRLDAAAFTGWQVKRLLGTFCHGQSLVRIQRKQLNLIELHGLCPFY